MSILIPRIHTQAETQLAEQFAALGAVAPERTAAFAAFAALGLPNRRVEAWHFTDLRAAMAAALPSSSVGPGKAARPARFVTGACTLVLIDGNYVAAHSDPLPPGVRIVENREPAVSQDAALLLNHAFTGHALALEIAPGAMLDVPLHIAHIVTRGPAHAVFARVTLNIGARARVTVLESINGLQSSARAHQANVALEFLIGDHAQCTHVADFDAGSALLIDTLSARLGKEAALHSFALLSGGQMVRRQMFVALAGEGAHVALDGVHLARAHEHIDTTLVVEHQVPHCTSRETFRSILDGEATVVYQGKVIVAHGAQKSDGKMMSKAVLLSDAAVMDNKPELEIFADDVVCGHGATVGALDEDQIFYCAARGISRGDAEALLLRAFAGEVIETISSKQAIRHLTERLSAWLASR